MKDDTAERRAPARKRRRLRQVASEMHAALRSGGDSPMRTAGAVGAGTAIGCVPAYGAHWIACLGIARAFRLNIVTTYLAAHINNPVTAPLLLYVSYGVGHSLFAGRWPELSVAEIRDLTPWALGRDLFLGSAVFGIGLGAILGALAYLFSARWGEQAFTARLREEACRPYAKAGIVHWEFVRGKIKYDPVFIGVLREGLLPRQGALTDLGCGRGVLFALLRAARQLHRDGGWNDDWPAPPGPLRMTGVERRAAHAAVAEACSSPGVTIHRADLARFRPEEADGFILFDVLHYLPEPEQDALLDRVGAALRRGGVVLIREADASGGLRFRLTAAAERACAIFRGSWAQAFAWRSADGWCGALRERGLEPRVVPVPGATPYANVLIEARRSSRSR